MGFVCHAFISRNECVTNEPQRTSAGRLRQKRFITFDDMNFWTAFFKFRTFCAQLGEKILRITGLIFLLQFLNVLVNDCQLEHLGSEKNLDSTSILFKGII